MNLRLYIVVFGWGGGRCSQTQLFAQACFACFCCAAGVCIDSHNYKVDNISKYVYLTVIIDITRKITKMVKFSTFDA